MSKVKVGGMLLFFIFAVVSLSAFAAGYEPPPMPGPEAMNLTADPSSIYLGGDTSIITATVFDNANYTKPMPSIGVTFNTTLGSITYLSPGGINIAPDKCWAETNESGVAMAVLMSGLELGNAVVYAWTGGETVVNETVLVEFKRPEYGVILIPDNQTKETEANENATYYIEVKNIGTGADSYLLNNVTSTEADFAWLNKTNVTLSGGESEVVELNVSSYFAGSYNTTVEAVGTHASANVTVTTVVRSFHNLSVTVLPEELQIVAPGVNVQYTLTITNKGNVADHVHLAKEVPAGVTATLSKDMTDLLSPEESEGVLLNVSSALEGEYIVNVTATSEGNISISDTVTTRTVVTREGFEFDTGAGGYPSIAGVHEGTIIPNHTIVARKLYTYPCAGTGGHTEYAEIYNGTWRINATWNGYRGGDYHNLTFPELFTLVAGEEYRYEIHTGSYPRIIHKRNHTTSDGFINCTSFVDVNGNDYDDWIPAIRLFP